MRIAVFARLLVIASFATTTFCTAVSASEQEFGYELSNQCPGGFELVDNIRCELRSIYQFYTSNQDKGVGGTQTALPKYRDGFTPQQIDLGRLLFFDPVLSGNNTQSCASCHQPARAFTDGRAFSIGSLGKMTIRSAPSLWNMAFLPRYFWDARAQSLEEQALGPLYSPVEMNADPDKLIEELSEIKAYRSLFEQAFPSSTEISEADVYLALAAFQSSLISLNSRYDQYAHGNHAALNEEEIAGLNVFRSFVARCAECHTPPLFTNNQVAVIGSPEPEGRALDIGAESTFGSTKLKGGFKVPSLRNIALSAPYMHSGRFDTLKEAAEFYTKGRGHAVPEGVDLHLHWHIWEPNLSDQELEQIVAFLHTLTDQSFLPKVPTELPSGLPAELFSSGANE